MNEAGRPSKQGQVLAVITKSPGIHKSELQRLLGLGWGTVAYHVHALQSKGRITVQRQGHRVVLFPAGIPAQQMAWLGAVRNPSHAALLHRIAATPGSRASELGRALGLSANTVRRHLAAMAQCGIVESRGTYGRRFYVTGTAVAHATRAPPPVPEPPTPGPASRRYDGQASRERILAAIQKSPGIHTSELTRIVGITGGNLAYHLRTLEASGHVAKSMHAHRTCYFPAHVPESQRALLVARRRGVAALILDVLERRPGAPLREIARETGARPSTVTRHLRHLIDDGLVDPSDAPQAAAPQEALLVGMTFAPRDLFDDPAIQ